MRRALSFLAIILLVFQIGAFAETCSTETTDSTTFYGEYVKKNEVQDFFRLTEYPFAFVLCKNLNVHSESDLSSKVIDTLGYSQEAEVIEETDDAYYIHFYDIISDTIIDKYGWISKEYVILDPPFFIANHPTAVFALPEENAKKLCCLDTYDSLRIIGEFNSYYIVSLNFAVGFVQKE